jgi:glycosidase
VGLPKNDWADEGWREEVEKIVRFWMDTGLDGLTIDAPIFYIGMTWEENNRRISNVIQSYGNTFLQPEGSQRTGWITEGNYNSMLDYGIFEWSESEEDAIDLAIKTGDPRAIEDVLMRYRDVRVAHGGVLSKTVRAYENPKLRHLYRATVAAIGDILIYSRRAGSPDAEETWILKTKKDHTALQQLSVRRKLDTNADNKYYAFINTAPDNAERILVILNFQKNEPSIQVDLSGVAARGLVDLRTGEWHDRRDTFHADLPGYGYRFFRIIPDQ